MAILAKVYDELPSVNDVEDGQVIVVEDTDGRRSWYQRSASAFLSIGLTSGIRILNRIRFNFLAVGDEEIDAEVMAGDPALGVLSLTYTTPGQLNLVWTFADGIPDGLDLATCWVGLHGGIFRNSTAGNDVLTIYAGGWGAPVVTTGEGRKTTNVLSIRVLSTGVAFTGDVQLSGHGVDILVIGSY